MNGGTIPRGTGKTIPRQAVTDVRSMNQTRCVVVVLVHRNFAMRTFEILNINYSNCYYCKLFSCCAATVGFVFFICGF